MATKSEDKCPKACAAFPEEDRLVMRKLTGVIGRKWKLLLLWILSRGTMRFVEIRRELPEISQKMLTQKLRELVDDGFVRREVFAEVPLRVEYSLTPLGESFQELGGIICRWAMEHKDELLGRPPQAGSAKQTQQTQQAEQELSPTVAAAE